LLFPVPVHVHAPLALALQLGTLRRQVAEDQASALAQHEAALTLAKTSAAVRVAELQQEVERLRALVQATQGSGNAALTVAQQAAEAAIKVARRGDIRSRTASPHRRRVLPPPPVRGARML
jgi:hypothetical protein